MAKIPLRVYVKEIENQIDRGEIEQAIAHARHILKSYPKHIDTYRILGKAYLEGKRYTEASDILQRVLSVIPDDFVAQIGMSIIREDEGNLDAAIWHMERAYEVQPFNPAVQDELRRLYGRRDGIEPPKIRLTRGALVRMYARGGLIPQAIAETRAALAEDPQRFDLLVLLARLYNLAKQKIEATEVCSTLISKLPYCYEANLLLAEILPGTSRANDARKFQQRVYALDPYAAFVSPAAPSSDQVPDQAVMIEQLDWEASMKEAQAPEWAQAIGVDWEDTEEERLPDWISALEPETQPPAPPEAVIDEQPISDTMLPEAVQEEAPASTPEDELIPDWMKDAGWEASDRRADEIMAGQEETEEAIASAEIPEWLQTIAPAGALEDTGEEAERDDWLASLLGKAETQETESKGEPVSKPVDEMMTAEQESAPDWLSSLEVEQSLPDESAEETPDWLAAIGDQTSEKDLDFEGTPFPQETAASEEELPALAGENEIREEQTASGSVEADAMAWLEALAARQGADEETLITPPEQRSEDLPDWLRQEIAAQAEQPATAAVPSADEMLPEAPQDTKTPPEEIETLATEGLVEESPAAGAELPDWLQTFGAELSEPIADETGLPEEEPTSGEPALAEPPSAGLEMSKEDTAMAWLESLAARQGADEDTLITPPDQRLETLPDWFEREIVSDQAAAEKAGEETISSEEKPSEETLPEWLQSIDLEKQIPEEIGLAEEKLASEPAESSLVEPGGVPDLSDMDAAMAWLEALAAKQGADEETLITPPDQRTETPPDWLQQEIETAQTGEQSAVEELPAGEELAREETLAEASSLPDWLQDIAELPREEALPAEEPEAGEPLPSIEHPLPDWLQELAAGETSEPAGGAGIFPDLLEQAASGGVEAALQGELEAAAREESPEINELSISKEESLPYETVEEEVPAAGLTSEAAIPQREEADLDKAMAWLESLAARQGAEEETLITPPEDRLETPPDWVLAEQAKAEEAFIDTSRAEPADRLPAELQDLEEAAMKAEKEEVPSVEEEAPAWLKDIGEETPEIEQPFQWEAAGIEPESISEAPQAEEAALPDWLQQAGEETTLPAAAQPGIEEIPEWLQEVAAEEEEVLLPGEEFQSAWEPEIDTEEAPVEAETHGETEKAIPTSLEGVRAALSRGDLDTAITGYTKFIENGEFLGEVIHDLRDALYRYPVDISIWQALGDAYAQNNQLQEALDAYTKAEELLR